MFLTLLYRYWQRTECTLNFGPLVAKTRSSTGLNFSSTLGQVMLKHICDVRVCTYHSFSSRGC